MFTPLPTDLVAAGEADARAEALELGRQRAETAADLRGDLEDPEARAAFVSQFVQAFAESFIEGAREERTRIRRLLFTPGASMLLPGGSGGAVHLQSGEDGVVRAVPRRPKAVGFSGRAL